MGIYITDPAWDIKYQIVFGDTSGLFKAEEYIVGDFCFLRIRTRSGNTDRLNREFKDKYLLIIHAREKTFAYETWAKVLVQILDRNDLKPLFSPPSYKVTVEENTPPKTAIGWVSATDADIGQNAEFYYMLSTRSPLFTIHPTSGIIMSAVRLNATHRGKHQLKVLAVDRMRKISEGNAKRIDFHKHFTRSSYLSNFNENLPPGSSVLSVKATDSDSGENGFVTYNIANQKMVPFVIDPFTGVISTTKLMDYELMQRLYSLRIWASDSGSPFRHQTEVYVSLFLNNLNDNVPVFEKINCNGSIPWDLPIGHSVFTVSAIDRDELNPIKYEIKSGNEEQFFELNPVSGVISLRQETPLSFQFNSTIAQLTAIDSDAGFNGKMVYVISSGNEESCFDIDTEMGLLLVLSPLDHERTSFYVLNITVYDLGSPQKSTWKLLAVNVLDVNDNAPTFLQSTYLIPIPEDIRMGTTVAVLTANDADTDDNSRVKYSFITHSDKFAINSVTGEVIVTATLDRELEPQHILKVEARDQPQKGHQLFAIADLVISLEDVNDNSPYCIPALNKINVPEDLPLGTTLLFLEAFDPDTTSEGEVEYSLITDHENTFHLNEFTGDINDNPPQMSRTVFYSSVLENSPANTSILQVEAVDPDTDSQGKLTFLIINGNHQGMFAINPFTGKDFF
uniref:Cadherin domain-containing protein n=1 Tax=Laticauda laticaudata TaxID=8630 RepID=A0A8C5SUN5_LATLA